jgi:hypothetical protein
MRFITIFGLFSCISFSLFTNTYVNAGELNVVLQCKGRIIADASVLGSGLNKPIDEVLKITGKKYVFSDKNGMLAKEAIGSGQVIENEQAFTLLDTRGSKHELNRLTGKLTVADSGILGYYYMDRTSITCEPAKKKF